MTSASTPVDPDRLLGFVAVVHVPEFNAVFLDEIVAKEKRTGVGSALLRQVVLEVVPGCTRMELLVAKSNRDACAFYEALGFLPIESAGIARPKKGQACLSAHRGDLLQHTAAKRTTEGVVFATFCSRQRLVLEEMNLYRGVISLLNNQYATTTALPRDSHAQRKAQYVLALRR